MLSFVKFSVLKMIIFAKVFSYIGRNLKFFKFLLYNQLSQQISTFPLSCQWKNVILCEKIFNLIIFPATTNKSTYKHFFRLNELKFFFRQIILDIILCRQSIFFPELLCIFTEYCLVNGVRISLGGMLLKHVVFCGNR